MSIPNSRRTLMPWPLKKDWFRRLPPHGDPMARLDLAVKILIPLVLLILMALAVKCGSFKVYLELLQGQTYTAMLPALGAGYTLLMLFLQGLRTVLWAVYRPYPLSAAPLPSLTVVIPAYNEGRMVEMALNCRGPGRLPQGAAGNYLRGRRLHGRHLGLHRTGPGVLSPPHQDHPFPGQPRQEGGPVCRFYGGPGGDPGDRGFGQRHRGRGPPLPSGPPPGRRQPRRGGRQRQGLQPPPELSWGRCRGCGS